MKPLSQSVVSFTLLDAILISSVVCAAPIVTMEEDSPRSEIRVAWQEDVCVYTAGEWQLRIRYLQKGTRSEGQDGELLKAGAPVEPEEKDAVLNTPLGQLKHYGNERKTRWAVTGWNFTGKSLIKSSEKVKTTVPAAAPATE